MVYKIIITPVCSWSLLTLRSSNEIKYNTIVDIIIKDKKCIVTLVIMHLIYSISIASLFCTHLNVMCQIVVDVVSPSLVNTAIMQAITTGIVAPMLAY
jgi:hypothetical protein